MFIRGSGILLHISSLHGEYGIGDFGKSAYEFVDFLGSAGQKYWQILPLGTITYGDSPYQSFSSHAGNPYFIDLNEFIDRGYITRDEANQDFGDDKGKVDYYKLFINKMKILRLAYDRAKEQVSEEIESFYNENKSWLEDYALYMTIKVNQGHKSWQEWEPRLRDRDMDVINHYKKEYLGEIYYWVFLQMVFFRQWKALKSYANEKGISIIGDIPIYVAEDSADVWANSELFMLDEENRPIKVSGCPPDAFSEDGQLWGNPIYAWDKHDEQGYSWWIERIRGNYKLYDVLRLDHFRGFEAYWEVPYGDSTARNGRWTKGPGMKLFDAIKRELGDMVAIAEDLGFLTDGVIQLRRDSDFPGMKILQFAFDTREESDYLPHNYPKNCIVYTGTHDNDTVNGWLRTANPDDVRKAIRYLGLNDVEGYNWGFIRGAWSSVADVAIAQMQDFLGLGSEARMNIPSTLGGNWQWRLTRDVLSDELATRIKDMTMLYGR